MENVNEQKSEQTKVPQIGKVSRTWEAAMRYKGSVIVLDPTLYER